MGDRAWGETCNRLLFGDEKSYLSLEKNDEPRRILSGPTAAVDQGSASAHIRPRAGVPTSATGPRFFREFSHFSPHLRTLPAGFRR